MRLAILLLALALLPGCVTDLELGVRPFAIGFEAKCETEGLKLGPLPDGCVVGVEAGGWRVGVAIFPDVGPLEDKHEETHPAGVGGSGR